MPLYKDREWKCLPCVELPTCKGSSKLQTDTLISDIKLFGLLFYPRLANYSHKVSTIIRMNARILSICGHVYTVAQMDTDFTW